MKSPDAPVRRAARSGTTETSASWRGAAPAPTDTADYDQDALVRLQRIPLLRDLGLSLPAVKDVLAGQREWLSATAPATRAYVTGLGAMYVDDPRFRKNYDRYGDGTAVLVRDALTIYARHRLPG